MSTPEEETRKLNEALLEFYRIYYDPDHDGKPDALQNEPGDSPTDSEKEFLVEQIEPNMGQ